MNVRGCVGALCSPQHLRTFHLVFTVLWGVAAIPTVLLWADSILWVGLMSCWANFASHFAAYQASRVEVQNDEN